MNVQYYNIETLSINDVRQMIANGDDKYNNQIRVTIGGKVYLSQGVVGSQDIENLRFRFETFCAGGGYVGEKRASDSKFVETLYRNIVGNWKDGNRGYVEIWEY